MIDDLDFWEKEISCCKKLQSNRSKQIKNIEVVVNKIDRSNEKTCDTYDFNNICHVYKKSEYNLDYKTDKKLRTGNYKIDATIDFHGLTIDQALDVFLENINSAYYKDFRCLLFITGKGNNSEKNKETIKENFKKWVKLDFISDKILKCVQAVNKDGGSGAFYVLLKRNRVKTHLS